MTLVVKKRLNNSAVTAADENGAECVVFGKGIAFQVKEKEIIPEEKIERVFYQKEKTLLWQLIEDIPQRYFDISCEIIEYIQGNLKVELGNSIYLTLMDHISFIKERAEKGMLPKNTMKWEISRYYQEEYRLSKKVVELLEDEFEIELNDDERGGSKDTYLSLFKNTSVWMFFLGIFCYVSTEQGTSIFMTTFLEKYHGVNPQTDGAFIVSLFWGLMTAGCLVGMLLLKLIDSRLLLKYSGCLTIILLACAIWGGRSLSSLAFPAIGFSLSVMYSIVFSLALNSVPSNHGSFAGILCTAIVGGAAGPLIISSIADLTSLRIGMCVIFIFVAYIVFVAFTAHPLVNNKTVSVKELLGIK